jgi:hypothetical protein
MEIRDSGFYGAMDSQTEGGDAECGFGWLVLVCDDSAADVIAIDNQTIEFRGPGGQEQDGRQAQWRGQRGCERGEKCGSDRNPA